MSTFSCLITFIPQVRSEMSKILSIHRGSKIAMSLCACRLPSRFIEPEYMKTFRVTKEEWEIRTDKKLNIADGLAYLKTPGHFLPSVDERVKKQRLSVGGRPDDASSNNASNINADEIDTLLAAEGIPELNAARHDLSGNSAAQHIDESSLDSDNERNSHILWLVVKYKQNPDVWTFPFSHRRSSESAQTTLKRMSLEQIGHNFYFPSFSPIQFRKLTASPGPEQTRLFYYKGLFASKHLGSKLPQNSPVAEIDWLTREELRETLPRATWLSIRDSIPLG